MNAPTALNPTHVPAPVFTLVRHIGRKTGTTDEMPIIVPRVPAFGYPRALILKAPRRNEFRRLRC